MNIRSLKYFLVLFLLTILIDTSFLEAEQKGQKNSSEHFVLAKLSGEIIQSSARKNSYIPASIIKIATASYALFTFGENHRFSTYFYISSHGDLVLRGVGDPNFTSKDLELAAKKVASYKKHFNNIIFDLSFYGDELNVPGRGSSSNPYDAPISALSINYNSVSLRKDKDGRVFSGEVETPLTDFAKKIGKSLSPGVHRVRVGNDPSDALRQLYELLKIFLEKEGVIISGNNLIKKTPPESKLFYTHESEKNLRETVHDMLNYSNNFIANQLFYISSAYYAGPPASFLKAKEQFYKFLSREIGFSGQFLIEEGAGLSRNNSISISQGLKMLSYFYPYRDLLPSDNRIFYKSGTLTGVSNLAGYYDSATNNNEPLLFLYFDSIPIAVSDRVKIVTTNVTKKIK